MQTALISALTAAFVTLALEFFAKPSLEARKDRILEGARARRAALGHIEGMAGAIYRLRVSTVAATESENWDSVQEHMSTLDENFAKLAGTHTIARQVISRKLRQAVDSTMQIFVVGLPQIEMFVRHPGARGPAGRTISELLNEKVDILYASLGILQHLYRWSIRRRDRLFIGQKIHKTRFQRELLYARIKEVPPIEPTSDAASGE